MDAASPDGFLVTVDERIALALEPTSSNTDGGRLLNEAARHLCLGDGAKRFRPRWVHLLGRLFGLSEEARLRAAVSVELLHAASLLHDDVVDAGTTRRHRPTVNVKWSNAVAVLAGDWVLTRAVLEIAPLGANVVVDAVQTVASMTDAAVREVEARGRTDLGYSAWRRIAEGKAGELLAWCGRTTAAVGGSTGASELLSQLGTSLGVAFQMADDLRDLLDSNGGKDRFADLRNQNPSFPLVIAMERDPSLRERIRVAWEDEEALASPEGLIDLGRRLLDARALGAARALLRDEIDRCFTLLSTVAPPTIVDEFIGLAGSFAGVLAVPRREAEDESDASSVT
ncbi:MAG: polyprenyl synthetase family protein [Deltaproteobacteria bacterium]